MLTSASDWAVFILCIFSFTSRLLKNVFFRLPLKRTEKSHLAESIMCVTSWGAQEHGWALCSLSACLWLLLEVPVALQTPHCIWNIFIFKRFLPSWNLSQQQQCFGSPCLWTHLEIPVARETPARATVQELPFLSQGSREDPSSCSQWNIQLSCTSQQELKTQNTCTESFQGHPCPAHSGIPAQRQPQAQTLREGNCHVWDHCSSEEQKHCTWEKMVHQTQNIWTDLFLFWPEH